MATGFKKGDPVIARYRGADHAGVVVRQKKDGVVTVEIYDEDAEDQMWIDVLPQNVLKRLLENSTSFWGKYSL